MRGHIAREEQIPVVVLDNDFRMSLPVYRLEVEPAICRAVSKRLGLRHWVVEAVVLKGSLEGAVNAPVGWEVSV